MDTDTTMMTQAQLEEKARAERIAEALRPSFDAARLKLAERFAQAEEGRLIEQTERAVFESLNRLKTTTQEVGIQQRIADAESAFSPSGASGKGPR